MKLCRNFGGFCWKDAFFQYCDEDDIEAVNDYLDSVPIGERNSAIAELRERASNNYNIKMESWLDNVIERIESNTLGGQGLTRWQQVAIFDIIQMCIVIGWLLNEM